MTAEWFRRPKDATDWPAWKAAANEVASLEGEVLPWPYNPEPPTSYFKLVTMIENILENAKLESRISELENS